MAKSLGDAYLWPAWCINREEVDTIVEVLFGVTSITSTDSPDPDFTITRTGPGTYNLTFPPCPKMRISFQLQSPALTVQGTLVTARSATGGTATFKITNAAGAATDPATGDFVFIYFSGQARVDT